MTCACLFASLWQDCDVLCVHYVHTHLLVLLTKEALKKIFLEKYSWTVGPETLLSNHLDSTFSALKEFAMYARKRRDLCCEG